MSEAPYEISLVISNRAYAKLSRIIRVAAMAGGDSPLFPLMKRIVQGIEAGDAVCEIGATGDAPEAAPTRTRVVHCKREPYDVLIDRTTCWGNPFVIGRDGTREEVIAKHKKQFLAHPESREAARRELRGKTLGCWCAPKACHGDVLAEIANEDVPLETLAREFVEYAVDMELLDPCDQTRALSDDVKDLARKIARRRA